MKYISLLFVALLFLSSCITEKKCWNKYPRKVIVKDSIVYKIQEIIIHDTVFLKADTITTSDTVYINSDGTITSNKIMSETEYAKAYAQIINNKLFLELIQKDTAIARMLKENVQIKEVYETKTVEMKVWEVHWYDKVARVISGIFILAILVLITINIIKAYIKPL